MGIRGSGPTGMGNHHSSGNTGGGHIGHGGGSSWDFGGMDIGHNHHHRFLWI